MRGGPATELAVLPAKVDAPRLPAGAIRRRHLLDRIEASAARCVVVCGPAGYGKTTLLRQLVEEWDGAVGWLTADHTDEDPASFAAAVVRSLGSSLPLGEVEVALASPEPDLWSVALPALGLALRDAPVRFLLVVDDAHALHDREALTLLDHILDAVPDGSRIVLGGRSVPAIRLGRRSLAEPLEELGPDDLAFSAAEARAALRAGRGPALPDQAVDELVALTEGWPAGLHLAKLALEAEADPARAIRSLTGGGGDVARYIEQELLSAVSDDDRRFLLETSVLGHLDAHLCSAVTAMPDSGERLERFVRDGNLFVVPLATDGTYRYHHLFGELLLAQLRRAAPELEPSLHRRAAEHLARDGDADRAVGHALATGDLAFAADIVYLLLFPAIDHGTLAPLERWLSWFPPVELRSRPQLVIAEAWTAVSRGRTAEVAELLDLLAGAPEDDPLPDGTVSTAVAAAALRVLADRAGVKAMAEWTEVVIDAGPAGSPWWGFAHMQRAVAVHLAGTDDDPVALFDSAERATRGDAAMHAVTLAHCGLVRLQRNDPEGHDLVRRALAELVESGAEDHPLAAMVHTATAYAEAERGDRGASERAAARTERALESVGDAVPRAIAHHRLILADAALLRQDLSEAARHLAAAQPMLAHEPDALRLQEWSERVERRTSDRRRTDGASAWARLSPAELRVLEQLRTHRSLEEIGAHLFVSRNTVKSHTIAIYRKLGVSGRSAAVERAEELGLFAG